MSVPRWRARRPDPTPAPLALPAEPVDGDLEARRGYWQPIAMAMLQETTVPTGTVLDAYLGHLGLA